MATPKDVQDLLRLLTTGRNKIPMMTAMGRVKELRDVGLYSISTIACSDMSTIRKAIPDEKPAKSLLAACKSSLKTPATSTSPSSAKRAATSLDDDAASSSKRLKSAYSLPNEPLTAAQLEASLSLPQPSEDEEAISRTTIVTNRAPLVLAFALQLLKYTMPRQPLSGRLSLAQAVVSANSRSKAVSLGIEKEGSSLAGEGWPKVRIMGREVPVLKRGGYEWEEEREDGNSDLKNEDASDDGNQDGATQSSMATIKNESTPTSSGWTVSAPITSKNSTFIARSIPITTQAEAKSHLHALLSSTPDLKEASHNITAYRVPGPYGLFENSDDDGESGGGRHLLGVLKENNIVGVLLLVTRWYGGAMLGPDRWRIMSQVARDALSQRLRVVGSITDEALWGLDLSEKTAPKPGEMTIHRPEGARAYIMKGFPSREEKNEVGEGSKKKKKRTAAELTREKEENLALLLGALDLLFKSWVDFLGTDELDRRAWGWYVSVRPEVEAGVAGWGGKGELRLNDILKLRRQQG